MVSSLPTMTATATASVAAIPSAPPALCLGVPALVFGVVCAVGTLTQQVLPATIGLATLAALLVHFAMKNCHHRRLLTAHLEPFARNEKIFFESLAHATHGMALISPEGKWLRTNGAISRITGYSQDELMKIDFQTITHPDDLDADLHYVKQIRNKKIETYSMEKRYIRKDGQTIWALLTVSAVWDAAGNLCYFISEVQDINERKLLQEKLRRAEAQLRP